MKTTKILASVAFALMALTGCDEVAEQDRLVYVKPPEVARCTVIEDFTGQRCVNCPAATAEIEKLQEHYGADTLIAVGIHSGPFGKMPNGRLLSLATETGNQYYDYWKIEAQPGAMINRGAPVYDPQKYGAQVSAALSQSTPVTLNIERTYEEATRQLTVKVSGSTVEDVNCKLQLWLTEDGIVDMQMLGDGSTNREYVHNHVFRTSMTNDAFGDTFNLTATGGEKEVSYTTTLADGWNPSMMHIVAFVFDSKEILQATRKPIFGQLEGLIAIP